MSFLTSFRRFSSGAYFRERPHLDDPSTPTPENGCMFQAFEWHVPADQKHFIRLEDAVEGLKSIGVDRIWIPPQCKASTNHSNGYDVYDLYDIGEFEQKAGKSTKWGSKEELVHFANKAKEFGIDVLWDAVLNHRAAADRTESCLAVKVDPKNRLKEISRPEKIEGWFGFDFPGRGETHSGQKYHWQHFNGIDYDLLKREKAIFRIAEQGKHWAKDVDKENGNYDYLMFSNVDFSNTEVRQDVKNWIAWLGSQVPLGGVRLDAIKHYSEGFLKELLDHIDEQYDKKWFKVGEYWKFTAKDLCDYLNRMGHRLHLFDSTLVYKFLDASQSKRTDLRKVLQGTLLQAKPDYAVTFVMNHDTQPGQALEAALDPAFKPLAYALILLRQQGYPCLFYGDLYGIYEGPAPSEPACNGKLPDLCLSRKLYAYGRQHDYFDFPYCIGWTREGTHDRLDGLAVVMSYSLPFRKKMYVGRKHAGEVWSDIMGYSEGEVQINKKGEGIFACQGVSVSVYAKKDAPGRENFGRFNDKIYGH